MKYFEQETNYTCAIACMRMVMSHYEYDFSEGYLARECKSHETYGTKPKDIIRVFKMLGFEAELVEDSSIDDVRKAKDDGYDVILLISVDVPHCVVYLGDNNNHIFYHDPFFGENQYRNLRKFLSDKNKYPFVRWWIDVESVQKYYPDIDFKDVREYEGERQFIKVKRLDL